MLLKPSPALVAVQLAAGSITASKTSLTLFICPLPNPVMKSFRWIGVKEQPAQLLPVPFSSPLGRD